MKQNNQDSQWEGRRFMRWHSLSFTPDLEADFQDYYFEHSIWQIRLAMVCGIFFYWIFSFLDAWLFPQIKHLLWLIRFGLFTPLLLAILLFSFHRRFRRCAQPLVALAAAVAGLGIVAMIGLAPSPENYLYHAGLILVFLLTYTFLKLRFVWASIAGAIIILGYEFTALAICETPWPVFINNNFFFLSGNILGMVACYSIELYTRKDFYQVRLLQAEREKVNQANQDLERRVADRTVELTRTNQELKQEVNERRRTETALRNSEQRFRSLSDNSPEIIYTLAEDGRFNYVNPAWEKVLGHRSDEVLGKYFVEFVRKEDARDYVDIFKKIRDEKETVYNAVGTLIHKDGSRRIFYMSGGPNIDSSGRVTGMVGLMKDFTEQHMLEAQLKRAQQMARLGHWELDLVSREMLIPEASLNIFGIESSRTRFPLEQFMALIHEDDRDYVREWLDEAPYQDGTLTLEHRILLPEQGDRIVYQLAEVVQDHQNRPIKLVGTVQDITEIRRSEEQMQLLGRIFERTVEGIMVTDGHGIIELVNQAFTTITGYSAGEAIGQSPRLLSSGRQSAEFYQDMWSQLQTEGHWQGEIWNRRKNGEAYLEWLTITAIQDQHKRVSHYIGVFHDITEQKRNEDQINFHAYHDALTNLPNRALFYDRLKIAVAQAQRETRGLTVLLLDLDNFKTLNDSLGHVAGDRLLQAVAQRLLGLIRKEDSLARLGGDEFVLMFKTEDADYAVMVAQRILNAFTKPFTINDQELYVSASIGITLYPQDGFDPETLVANADMAMYKAKEHGRNTYQFFTPALNTQVKRRVETENAMRRALENDEFRVYYQPKVDAHNETIVGFEALVRWERPSFGLVPPGDFIPIAEDTGLIVDVGRHVLETACAQTKIWHAMGFPHLHVAVNLSPRQFRQENLVEMVRAILAKSDLAPECLELEVTETVVMHSVEDAIRVLKELSDFGVRLSLDDFGRGYSSLYYLKRFPIHNLKIDRSFVADIIEDPDAAAIVNTIIAMSRNLNLKVVAEGVETKEQIQFLRQHGCDQMQGFFFSRPLPPDKLGALLAAHHGPGPAAPRWSN